MPFTLRGVTADDYTDANTLTCPESWRVLLNIDGNPVDYQLQYADPSGETSSTGWWLPEAFIPGGTGFIVVYALERRTTGIRLRSDGSGKPALYYAELVPPNELPPEMTVPGTPNLNSQRLGGPYPKGTELRR